ncbi:MAG: hypothetical protein HZC55_18675 [Verrucomicrobia bacterium]|jgi:catechol 2,3-dioxygenase-like lactoylglutathione lyase family enzyme|nr:hypothetical protein [Verrucomicrobiota bacterium]
MRKRPAIPRLDGGPQTVLLVDDVDRAVEFYRKGLRLPLRDSDAGRYAEFEMGDGAALLLVKRDGSIAPMAMPAAPERGGGLTFAVAEDGLEWWKTWFATCAIKVERETKWVHGGRSLYVRDPEGRRLEFKTPPVVPPPKPADVTGSAAAAG